MKGQYKYSRSWKRIAGTGIAGFALAILLCSLDAVAEGGCSVRYETASVVAEVLRHAVLACWQLAPVYLFENSRGCHHLFQIVASVWPLFCVIAG
jgi:hypothetical protein